ncbi:hypothetical protein E1176_19475 [Fulvivirga sp. RKSG066]|uniref:hypothetical protein n=1 Tax=Fulvivirga aurantia TaxID=2529383 RepID=UPI0012BC06C2|nr:hypothetical protein [Fulvivirga aurantia]MTI23219.1 hypothetical protein [Fulvivirga aurantia]
MKTLHFILFGYLLVGFHPIVNAQDSLSVDQISQKIVGHWAGSGWSRTPDGNQVTFNQTEDIYTKLDGKILVINGLGRDQTTNEKVFEAFGIINYDAIQNKLVMNAYTLEGRHTLANFELTPEGFDWWFDAGNGTVKYKAKISADTWIEEGYYSPDNENWYPFFSMELKKKS